MVSAPVISHNGTQPNVARIATHFAILVGDTYGSKPTENDEVVDYFPISIERSSNGNRDDVLTFGLAYPFHLQDMDAPQPTLTIIEVRALDDNGHPTIPLGWGQVVKNSMRIDDASELITIEARILDAHFGKRAVEYPVWYYYGNSVEWSQHDIVFNPEIDGEIRKNRNRGDYSWLTGTNAPDPMPSLFLDYESAETDASKAENSLDPGYWTIRLAIYTVCWMLNPDERFIKNPTWNDLAALDFFTAVEFKNVSIPFGASLPDALDAILVPLEFGWYLHHYMDQDGNRQTAIQFYRRGAGDTVKVGLQRVKRQRDDTITNVSSFDATFSLTEMANRIEVYGELRKQESSFSLKPGWQTNYKSYRLDELRHGTDVSLNHPEVGRLWVFNEDGTYTGNGSFTKTQAIEDAGCSFGTHHTYERRRRFLKCLTSKTDDLDLKTGADSYGYQLKWWNPRKGTNSSDLKDAGWEVVQWPFQVAEKQMGILFTGETPPHELWTLIRNGQVPKLFLTATVAGDRRVSGIAERLDSSNNRLDMPLILDMRDKFEWSEVRPYNSSGGSIFDGKPSSARDDTAPIQEYAEAVRQIEDIMRLDCSIELEGCLHPEYEIGDIVTKISERNIPLTMNAAGRGPQIVGFNLHCQEQKLELLFETYRKERPRIVKTSGQRTVIAPIGQAVKPAAGV